MVQISAQQKSWIKVAFGNFFIVAVLGVILRYAFVGDIPDWYDYRDITHAHSHGAILGWLYSGLFIAIVALYSLSSPVFNRLFWLAQVCVFGMLISFPIEGYGIFSILFNSLHILFSYGFIFYVYKILKQQKKQHSKYAVLFIQTALFFLFLSTLATWLLPVLSVNGYKGSAIYYATIQFYLHFQFNGWFIFTVIALLLQFAHIKKISLDQNLLRKFYKALVVSCMLTYALAVTWSTPDIIIFMVNSIGILVQLIALYYFILLVIRIKSKYKQAIKSLSYFLWTIAITCLVLKIVIQGLVAFPYLATISYTIKNFVIGFIHLLNLGFVSTFLLGLFFELNTVNTKLFTIGTKIFLIGFIGSEILLFLQGLLLWISMGFIPSYYLMIMIISIFLPLGIGMVLLSYFNSNSKTQLND